MSVKLHCEACDEVILDFPICADVKKQDKNTTGASRIDYFWKSVKGEFCSMACLIATLERADFK